MKEAKPTPNLPVFINAEDFLDSLPPGYCFKPRDDELIVHYLRRRVCNKPLPPNRIKEVELYKYSPDDLTQADNASSKKESEWYFFTPRDRKYVNGSRPSRTAGDGFWKATGSDTSVMFKGNIVGFKKTLVYYYGKPPKGEKTNWIMHEYVLSNPPARQRAGKDDMRLDDWVLCRLHNRNHTKVGATRQATDQKQEEENYAITAAQTEILEQQYENILPLQIEIPAAQAEILGQQYGNIPPPQTEIPAARTEILKQEYGNILPPQTEQVQVQDFNLLLPQQICSMPLYNPYDDSTSGFASFPESLHPMLEYHFTMFPRQDVSVYGNIITTVAPIATIPPPQFQHSEGHDPLNMHQQQQQFSGAPSIHNPSNMHQQQQFSSVPNIHDPLNMHQQQFSGAPYILDPSNMHQQQQQFSSAPNIHDPLNMHQQQQFSGAPNIPDSLNMDQQQQQFSGAPNIHGPLNMHQQEQQFSDAPSIHGPLNMHKQAQQLSDAPNINEFLVADQYILVTDHGLPDV
ncbi:hypothetical protein QUC31_018047 [Theobroma cacao]